MNLLPKSHEEFSQETYWNNFFKQRGTKAFEWYGEYPQLCQHLHKYIKIGDFILIVGCGNSSLGSDLHDLGYNKIINIDISQVVIRQMQQLHEKERPNLKFLQMDALNMTFENESFSVVLDKGTIDALMPDAKPQTVEQVNKYFLEIVRTLKIGGRYICISLLQEHILNKLLSYFPQNNWMVRIIRCIEAEQYAFENEQNAMPVFMVICTKLKNLPNMILEINMGSGDKMQRLEKFEDVLSLVRSVQKAAFVCSALRHNSIAYQDEITFDLSKPDETAPRYSVYVVDQPYDSLNSQYAAFIVPQGRESGWLFSAKEGRKHLLKVAKYNRLAIITMHRGQHYDNLEAIKSELNGVVRNLAPLKMTEKILFLSQDEGVGKRVIVYEGNSEFSGDYIVEDVETDTGIKYRRLFYLTSQLVIQSEAKIKTMKLRNGKTKEIIDSTYLTCQHHVYMSLGAHMACANKPSSVAVIGLGGGSLCMFLKKILPRVHITAIDIDEDMLKVGESWFGLKQDDTLSVTITDGIQFLKKSTENEVKYDAILFDVDNKDASIGMSCPPKQFLESSTLDYTIKCLKPKGLFVLNIVLRDETLRPPIIRELKNKFKTIASYKLEEDLNEVIVCSVESNEDTVESQFVESCKALNIFFKSNKHTDQLIEIKEFVNSVKINI